MAKKDPRLIPHSITRIYMIVITNIIRRGRIFHANIFSIATVIILFPIFMRRIFHKTAIRHTVHSFRNITARFFLFT